MPAVAKNADEPKTASEKPKKPQANGKSRTPTKIAASSSSSSTDAPTPAFRFPMSRVRRLVQGTDGGVRPSHESVFLINKAAEMFLEKFAEDGYECGKGKRKKNKKKSLISYDHLSLNVHTKKKYEFLSDFVPQKLKTEDALKAVQSTE